MRFMLPVFAAALAGSGWGVCAADVAGPTPSYEVEGLINGDEKPRIWYSADTGNAGAALHYFRVYGNWDSKSLRLLYKCEAGGVGTSPGWVADWCPGSQDWQRSNHIRRFSMRLDGPEAEKYDLTYGCWVAQDGHTPLDRGDRQAGEWCGVAHSDEKVWVTRIVITLRRKPA